MTLRKSDFRRVTANLIVITFFLAIVSIVNLVGKGKRELRPDQAIEVFIHNRLPSYKDQFVREFSHGWPFQFLRREGVIEDRAEDVIWFGPARPSPRRGRPSSSWFIFDSAIWILFDQRSLLGDACVGAIFVVAGTTLVRRFATKHCGSLCM